MFFDIDPQNGIAIYDQVSRQIKFSIAQGDLQAGDRVPSVRELAKELVINPNTIARALQTLQQEGIVESRRGIGFEVAKGARALCRKQRRDLIRERLLTVLTEGWSSGLTEEELEQLVRQALTTSKQRSKPS